MSQLVQIDGFKELDNVLREMPRNIGKRAMTSAGRAAAKPIVKQARQLIESAPTETQGNKDGFQHLRALAKLTKTVVYRGSVSVQIDRKAADLPMTGGSGSGWWAAYQTGLLFAFGRRNAKGTGKTSGFLDWVTEAGKNNRYLSTQLYKRGIESAVSKAIDRTIARYGKK